MSDCTTPEWLKQLVEEHVGEPEDELADLLWEMAKGLPDPRAAAELWLSASEHDWGLSDMSLREWLPDEGDR